MGDIVKQETTPGIGVSGLVMCPLFKGACLKQGCEWWVELNYTDRKVARCSISWLAILNTEIRTSIDKLKEAPDAKVDIKNTKG